MTAYIRYKGISSSDMGLRLLNTVTHDSPGRRIDWHEVDGMDGELGEDRESLRNVSKVWDFRLETGDDRTLSYQAARISQWLKEDVGWHPLYLSWDPKYTYTAIVYERYSVTEQLRNRGTVSLPFTLKPIKYRTKSLKFQEIANGEVLRNPEKRTAKPLIHIEGAGDITLQNNGRNWLILKGMDGPLTVDSQSMSVYDEWENQFDRKMNSSLRPLFPLLFPGENKITWTGNVTRLEIVPRWEAVVG